MNKITDALVDAREAAYRLELAAATDDEELCRYHLAEAEDLLRNSLRSVERAREEVKT